MTSSVPRLTTMAHRLTMRSASTVIRLSVTRSLHDQFVGFAHDRPAVESSRDVDGSESRFSEQPAYVDGIEIRELDSVEKRPNQRALRAVFLVAVLGMHHPPQRIIAVGFRAIHPRSVIPRQRASPAPDTLEHSGVPCHELERRVKHVEREAPTRSEVFPDALEARQQVVFGQV